MPQTGSTAHLPRAAHDIATHCHSSAALPGRPATHGLIQQRLMMLHHTDVLLQHCQVTETRLGTDNVGLSAEVASVENDFAESH